MCRINEQRLQDEFINNNPRAEYGINAAVQHNKLYARTTTNFQREEIRNYWRHTLDVICAKYVDAQDFDAFLADIRYLRNQMNAEYGHLFCETGFRFSHAQKSLSIHLKNEWCHNRIPLPPFCPIDRTILNLLGQPWNVVPWTRMEEEDYVPVVGEVFRRSELTGLSAAQWELVLFTGNNIEE